ncbi:ATP-dependent Clp protease ATP-binding subunit [Streptomyces sp. TRM49041]|uniref:ATP-dependent Clp protease ATP-binding subunit n=1 Tax=Streptomyces sp. TRM49041 TaxID=2603216 RepID=UPI0011EE759C|nr:ATP-dependent Clp protease ATP-binding subunit [Streptomyces sp. TRM49041]
MSSGFVGPEGFGPDPFSEFLARLFGGTPASSAARRGPRYSDIARMMSEPARRMVDDAASYAAEHGSADLETEHLLRAALDTEPTRDLVFRAGADPDELIAEIDRTAGEGPPQSRIAVTPAVKRALLDAHDLARHIGASYIGPEHVLAALAANPDSAAGRILRAARFDPGSVPGPPSGPSGQRGAPSGGWENTAADQRPAPQRGTPTLDKYGRDLTDLARAGRVDPVIGRELEIEQTIEVLSRRGKNNPVLIGDAGVGKTAVVEGLAQRIADGDVPDTLSGRRVVALDMTGVVAGTRYRGDFEERMTAIIDEVRAHSGELVVFIDELHTVVGAGGGGGGGEGGSMDAGNILKPALARGEMHVIGATTLEEYRRHVEKDAALARRFQPILVPEPSPEDALEILRGLGDRYEAHHQVRYTEDALRAAVELSDRYLTERFLPDKAIDLIDQAGARVRLRSRTQDTDVRAMEREAEQLTRDKDQAVAAEQYERATELRDRIQELEARIKAGRGEPLMRDDRVLEVTAEDIAQVVSRQTGIPVSRLTQEEKERLLGLEAHLRERVIGQDEAVAAVSEAVLRSRAGLADPRRPIGSFLFLGPTGVGKTELARALSDALFGSEERMVRLDMSEFQERHTVSRLVGAPPGYVGHEEAGQLTEAVRRHPYSLLLLDEVEKAHPDVFNILLQVLDDGRLTDSQGRTVDFKNTVIVMTSNLGSEAIGSGRGVLGFGADAAADESATRDRVLRPLREHFRPEFLNRIDEIVIFRRLEETQLRQITDLLLEETRRRLRAQEVTVDFAPEAVDWLARQGYEPEYGARPLRRTIQREVDNELSRLLLDGRLPVGGRVRVDVTDGKLDFRTEPEAGAEPEAAGGVSPAP